MYYLIDIKFSSKNQFGKYKETYLGANKLIDIIFLSDELP